MKYSGQGIVLVVTMAMVENMQEPKNTVKDTPIRKILNDQEMKEMWERIDKKKLDKDSK